MRAGSINAWRCKSCGGLTVAIHVDDGTTPMFLRCRAGGQFRDCKTMAVSMGYPFPPPKEWAEAIAWEWYKPTPKQYRKMSREMQIHIDSGGLDLRPLSNDSRAKLIPSGGTT